MVWDGAVEGSSQFAVAPVRFSTELLAMVELNEAPASPPEKLVVYVASLFVQAGALLSVTSTELRVGAVSTEYPER